MICGCYRQRLHRCIPVGTLGRVGGGGGRRRAETVINTKTQYLRTTSMTALGGKTQRPVSERVSWLTNASSFEMRCSA
jgi:hypothetical protein